VIARTLATLAIAVAVATAAPSAPGGTVMRVEHRDPQAAPARGPTTAPVTVELFFEPKTNAAMRMPAYRALERLQTRHPTRIRLVYRVLKRGAQQLLAVAVLEAHAQGKYDVFMDELHADRTSNMLSRDRVLELAKRVGVDTARLTSAIEDGRYNEVFEQNDRRFERYLHGSTPGALFNVRVPRGSLGAPNDAELERAYVEAYERALDLIDRGVPVANLIAAFEGQAGHAAQPYVRGDDDSGDDHKLARPPMDIAHLPSFGRPIPGALPVLVLCHPNDGNCAKTLATAQKIQRMYADEVRVLWAPWFDVARGDAAELALLGDAALCAEQVGTSPDDPDASPGWQWITLQLRISGETRARRPVGEKLIDTVSAELEIDPQRLSACRARTANTTLDWIGRARRSGVTRVPAVVIGGRIYAGVPAEAQIQLLIEAELAPGLLARCATIGCESE
jgi:hypothetical protein